MKQNFRLAAAIFFHFENTTFRTIVLDVSDRYANNKQQGLFSDSEDYTLKTAENNFSESQCPREIARKILE